MSKRRLLSAKQRSRKPRPIYNHPDVPPESQKHRISGSTREMIELAAQAVAEGRSRRINSPRLAQHQTQTADDTVTAHRHG